MGRHPFALALVCTISLAVLAVLVLALTGVPPSAQATPAAPCTTVSSDITATTTWAGACYHIVTPTIAIQTGVILTIAPSTTTRLEFDPGAQLIVNGSLQALGAPDRPITFTAALTPTRCAWQNIAVPINNQGLLIQYATVEYACAGLRSFDADQLKVFSSIFRFNGGGSDVYNGAIAGDADNSIISGTVIYSSANGILLNESFGNLITRNTIDNIDGYGLSLIKDSTSGGSNNQLTDNLIWNTAHGLRLENGSNNLVTLNSIFSNTSSALYLSEQAVAQISDNHVYSNGGNPVYRAAIFVTGTTSLPSIQRNVVLDTAGDAVQFDASAMVIPSQIAYANTNALCSLPGYEFRNSSATLLADAARNWWGTNTPIIGVNFIGPIALSDPMHLSLTTSANQLLGGQTALVTVTLRDSLNNTVSAPNHPGDVNARRIALASPLGSFSPNVVIVNNQGIATTTLTASPAGGTGLITATAFCNYAVTATLQVTATTTDLVVLKDDNIGQVVKTEKPAARALIEQSGGHPRRALSPFVGPGDPITYTIAVVNVSSYTATNIVVTETLPLYTTYVGTGWTNTSGRTYVLNIGPLAPGDGRILYFGVRVVTTTLPAGTQFIVNQVCGFGFERDTTPADNCHITYTPLIGPTSGRTYLPLLMNGFPLEPPQVSFTKLTYVVTEGTPQIAIDVKLDPVWTQPVTVTYFTGDGTATAGQDYTATAGSLVFAPGETLHSFDVGIISDTLREYWETVGLYLDNPQNAIIGYPGVATLYINDERPCAVPSSTLISLYSPMDVAYDYNTDRLFIANRDGPLGGSLNVAVISPTPQITRTLTGLLSAQGVAQDVARQRLYVVGWDWLNVVDSSTYVPTTTLSLGTEVNAHAVAYNPNNSKIYVTGFGDNSITIIDANTLNVIARWTNTPEHPLNEPSYIAIEPNSNKVYVTNHDKGRPSGWVTVIEGFTNQIVKSIYLDPGGELYGIAADPVHGHIYVAAINAANTYVIDAATDTQLGSFQVRRWSDNHSVPLRMIAVNPNPGLGTKIRLWLTSSSTENAGLDNIISLTGNWPNLEAPALGADLPPSPERGLKFDPISKYLFVASAASNRVTILRDTPETQTCLWPFIPPRGPTSAGDLYVVVNQTNH